MSDITTSNLFSPALRERAICVTRLDLKISHEQFLPYLDSSTLPFTSPPWATREKPTRHTLFDICKNNEIIGSIPLDEKPMYIIGRNPAICDVTLEHCSVSRVHAILIHHVDECVYIVDLGSGHGTHFKNMKLEPYQPTLLKHGTILRFGASTREYVFKYFLRKERIEQMFLSDDSMSMNEEEKLLQKNTMMNLQLSYRLSPWKNPKCSSLSNLGKGREISGDSVDPPIISTQKRAFGRSATSLEDDDEYENEEKLQFCESVDPNLVGDEIASFGFHSIEDKEGSIDHEDNEIQSHVCKHRRLSHSTSYPFQKSLSECKHVQFSKSSPEIIPNFQWYSSESKASEKVDLDNANP